jgi:hypothetical protein
VLVVAVGVAVGVTVRPRPMLVGVCMVFRFLLDANHIIQDCPLVVVGQGCRGQRRDGAAGAGEGDSCGSARAATGRLDRQKMQVPAPHRQACRAAMLIVSQGLQGVQACCDSQTGILN